MTIWAYGNQVLLRVNGVAALNFAEWPSVVDVDEAIAKLTVGRAEVEAAHPADRAEVSDAGAPSGGVPLVGVHGDTA